MTQNYLNNVIQVGKEGGKTEMKNGVSIEVLAST